MYGTTKISLLILPVAALGLVFVPPNRESPEEVSAVQLDVRECPRDAERFDVPATVSITELHDCQRFIIPARGPVDRQYQWRHTAIYAVDGLRRAIANIDRLPGRASGRTVATILAEQPYSPLGIEGKHNCLVMFRENGELKAKMIPNDPPVELRCNDRGPVSVGRYVGKELVVHLTTRRGLGEADFPPVVRWDWDETNGNQYIGVACGSAWCEIGDASLTQETLSPTQASTGVIPPGPWPTPAADNHVRRVREVKGWYDEQYLAFYTGVGAVPTRLLGTLIPTPDLDLLLANPGEFSEEFVPVATVRVRDDGAERAHLRHYAEKYNFFPVRDRDASETTLALCHGTWQDCGLPSQPSDSRACFPDPVHTDAITDRWWIEYTHRDAPAPVYRCVKYYPVSSGIAMYGSVRWRWVVDDEGAWISCPAGCCEGL